MSARHIPDKLMAFIQKLFVTLCCGATLTLASNVASIVVHAQEKTTPKNTDNATNRTTSNADVATIPNNLPSSNSEGQTLAPPIVEGRVLFKTSPEKNPSTTLQDPNKPANARAPIGETPLNFPVFGSSAGSSAANEAAPPANIWERIRAGYGMTDLDSAQFTAQLRFYGNKPQFIARVSERSGPYLYHVVAQLEQRKMPLELALLPFVESAFNVNAKSTAKALGMWQFIPSTGRVYDLQQNAFFDERKDVIASTDAAINYLSKLYAQFGDWHLALAAYNCGEGCIGRAISRNLKAGKGTAFTDLKLPRETRAYVPKLLAIKTIIASPERFGVHLPVLENQPYFEKVVQEKDLDISLAAKFADMPLDEFKILNPQFNRPIVTAGTTLLLPIDKVETFLAQSRVYTGQLSSWTALVLSTPQRLIDLAQKLKIDPINLALANNLAPGAKLRGGSTLVVPKDMQNGVSTNDIPAAMIRNATLQLVAEQKKSSKAIKSKLRKLKKPSKVSKTSQSSKPSKPSKTNTAKHPATHKAKAAPKT